MKSFSTPSPASARTGRLPRWLQALAAGLLCTVLVACGGGGVVPKSGVTLRTLSPDFAQRKAVSYSPYRTANRDTEVVTTEHILEDLSLLAAGGFRLIRLFDSSDNVARATLQVIKDNQLDIKVMLGIYIVSGNDAFNQAEVARGIALAQSFADQVLAVSVGNETMVSWSFNPVAPTDMAAFLKTVRDKVAQPVTTDDNWAFWAAAPAIITDQIDFVALHTYPLADSVFTPGSWDWQQEAVPAEARAAAMMDAAIGKARADYAAARGYLDGKGLSALPIVIGETGWKAIASGGETYRAHPVNQQMYFERLKVWEAESNGPLSIFYFEAFDEPWKGGDDKWGLFNVARQARYMVRSLYPESQWEPGNYSDADALYHIPLAGGGPVVADRYATYAEHLEAGEARPVATPVFNGWNSPSTASYPEVSSASAPTDPGHSIEITPIPESWGWGLAQGLPGSAEDLSNFQATGMLNFSIRTTYAGKIEVGFLTGDTTSGSAYDVYLAIAPGQYGYVNDGAWHRVSIPIADITPHGAMAFGMTDPNKSKLDLTKVTNPFVIADRYAQTGKPENTGDTTKIYIDEVFWSK